MAKTEQPGSDRQELIKFLKLASNGTVNMAIAMAKDGSAIVKLDKVKGARALEKSLKDVDGTKNWRHGTVVVDKSEPKLAKFVVNATVSGYARKLVVALKGTGFVKVEIVTEDGKSIEGAAGEDKPEDTPDSADAAAAPPAAAAAPPATPPGPDTTAASPDAAPPSPDAAQPATPPGSDAAQLTKDLTGLVKQMIGVIGQNPALKAQLAKYATDAQASLKNQEFDKAASDIDLLRRAIRDATAPASSGQPGNGSDAAAPQAADPGKNNPDPAMVQKLQKLKTVWDATLLKINSDIDKLIKAVNEQSDGHELAESFESDLQKTVEPLLATVDSSLSDILARAARADTADEHRQFLDQARATVTRFTKYTQSNKVIEHLDGNPFVQLAIGPILTKTLSAISTTIH